MEEAELYTRLRKQENTQTKAVWPTLSPRVPCKKVTRDKEKKQKQKKALDNWMLIKKGEDATVLESYY